MTQFKEYNFSSPDFQNDPFGIFWIFQNLLYFFMQPLILLWNLLKIKIYEIPLKAWIISILLFLILISTVFDNVNNAIKSEDTDTEEYEKSVDKFKGNVKFIVISMIYIYLLRFVPPKFGFWTFFPYFAVIIFMNQILK